MLNCVAPGCGHDATVVLMGMSLCSDHREHWCQIQVSYYLTLPAEQLFPYFEFMAKATQRYAEAQQQPVRT